MHRASASSGTGASCLAVQAPATASANNQLRRRWLPGHKEASVRQLIVTIYCPPRGSDSMGQGQKYRLVEFSNSTCHGSISVRNTG